MGGGQWKWDIDPQLWDSMWVVEVIEIYENDTDVKKKIRWQKHMKWGRQVIFSNVKTRVSEGKQSQAKYITPSF